MNLRFTDAAMRDYRYWRSTHPKIAARIKSMLRNALETPFTGLGKPEPLRHDLAGYWSRRIDAQHRLVYKVTDDAIIVISCRYHYEK